MKRMYLTGLCFVFMLGLAMTGMAAEQPSFDLDWYGTVKLDGAYDQNPSSHGNFSMWVESQAVDEDDNQFNMTANATRFGMTADGRDYGDIDVSARIEFDLFADVNGAAIEENSAMLQLRHAYFTIARGNLKLVAGQTSDLVSPLNPTTLNYADLWACGNIGYRRPQASLYYTTNASTTTDITIAGGFFRTIGSDLTPTFSLALGESSDGSDDGTDAAIPTFQALVDVNHSFSSGMALRTGISGLWGKLNAETNLGNSEKYESWAVVGHVSLDINPRLGISGELFSGSNLGSYLGGILNNSRIDGVSTTGGWGSVWFQASPKVKLSGGYGLDDPDNDDLGADRTRNQCVYGNIQYDIVPQVTLGLELSNWQTEYNGTDEVDNFRVQTSFALGF